MPLIGLHPKLMYKIAFASACSTFAYYGLTSILIVYIANVLRLGQMTAYSIFGTFSTLAFGLPVICGVLSDKYFGKKNSIIWGIFLKSVGTLLLIFNFKLAFYTGLSLIALGTGFFGIYKVIIGELYNGEREALRDEGFNIAYGIISVGGAFGALLCGYIGQEITWRAGFLTASFGAALGWISLVTGTWSVGQSDLLISSKIKQVLKLKLPYTYIVIILIPLSIFILNQFFYHEYLTNILVFLFIVIAITYMFSTGSKLPDNLKYKIYGAFFIFLLWSIYLMLSEQYEGSLNLFITTNVNLHIGSVVLPGLAINNFLPWFLPVILTPPIIYLWRRLDNAGHKPHSLDKIITGLFTMLLFLLTFWLGCITHASTGLVPFYFVLIGYFFMEIGELCIAPVTFSLVNKISPPGLEGTMMGMLGAFGALGQFLASKIGKLYAAPNDHRLPQALLPYYNHLFLLMAIISAVAVAITLILRGFVKRIIREG